MTAESPATPLIKNVRFRLLKEADLPALEWDGEYAHFRRLYREIYESYRRGRALMWVVEAAGIGVFGQLFVQLLSGRPELADGSARAYIYGFRIRPEQRSQGVGARMMQAAERDLYGRGFSIVTLNVGRDNPHARRLYERLGYTVVAAEPGDWTYLDEQGVRHAVHEPAWRMEKSLVVG